MIIVDNEDSETESREDETRDGLIDKATGPCCNTNTILESLRCVYIRLAFIDQRTFSSNPFLYEAFSRFDIIL